MDEMIVELWKVIIVFLIAVGIPDSGEFRSNCEWRLDEYPQYLNNSLILHILDLRFLYVVEISMSV